MQFKQIIGQTAIKTKLIQTVRQNRVSHAQLLLGPPGSGKLALAFAYAQYINCEQKGDDDSCGRCPSCLKIGKMIHPDVHYSYPVIPRKSGDKPKSTDYLNEWREACGQNPYLNLNQWLAHIQAENKQGNISVAECHDIIRKLNLRTFEARYKILILWHPEYLKEAGNVLLKIIEEPPENTLFLLVAEQPELILNTILSRTQLMRINRIAPMDLQTALQERHGQSPETAGQLASLTEGNYNEALSLLESETNDQTPMFREWIGLLLSKQGPDQVAWVDRFGKIGRENQKHFLRYVLHFMREAMLSTINGSNRITAEENEIAARISDRLDYSTVEWLVGELEKAHYHIERNANPRILMLDLSIRFGRKLLDKSVFLTEQKAQ